MTEGGGESRSDTDTAETDLPPSDAPASPSPLPVLSAAEWRAFFASLPPRELWRVLLKEPVSHARIFAGFRPSPEMLRTHPVVITRLVDEAVKHPAFAKVVREIAPPPPAVDVPEEAAPVDTAQENAAEIKPRRAKTDDEAEASAAKEKIKDLRGVVRTQVARIKELEAALLQAERDREAAKTEAIQHLAARRTAEDETRRAEAEAERQKRDRDRDARRATSAKEKAIGDKPPAPLSSAAAPAGLMPIAVPEKLLHDAAQRLIQENRFAQVSDLCREALRLLSEGTNASASERGRLHALYASALYGSHNAAVGEEQDRLAAAAFLDSGDVLAAAEAITRRFAQGTPAVRAADVPLLRRLTLLARKLNGINAAQTVFFRLRITAPNAFRRLQEASRVSPRTGGTRPAVSGGAAFAELLGGSPNSTGGAIGPDEAVSLPIPTSSGAPAITGVTPRQLVRAVDAGNVAMVQNVRVALVVLRDQNKQDAGLADALLEAVAELSPVSVCPFLQKTRPVYVDASNIARYNPDPLALEAPPRVTYLRLMREFLLRRGYFPVTFIADANLRFHVDDKSGYLEMLEKQIVREAPPGMTADEVLIREAYENHAQLITNDRLAEWGESARRIERVGFLFSASDISLTPF